MPIARGREARHEEKQRAARAVRALGGDLHRRAAGADRLVRRDGGGDAGVHRGGAGGRIDWL